MSAFNLIPIEMSTQFDDDHVDPVEMMLKRTGCIDLHHKVQECMAETKDWRKCQDIVKEFKHCMQKYSSSRNEKMSERQ